ncbi:MAG TPA: hypothetical protein VNG33_00840 [Polyangiaceae bacterium]|nr:hypothetical protein [Polyangiaceae bacterium]
MTPLWFWLVALVLPQLILFLVALVRPLERPLRRIAAALEAQAVAQEAQAEALATLADVKASQVELAALRAVESLSPDTDRAPAREVSRSPLPGESEDDWAARCWTVQCFQCGKPIALCGCNRVSSA